MDNLSDLTSALAEEELAATLSSLSESSPDVADELEALRAIYDASTPSLKLYTSSPSSSHTPSRSHSPTLRLVLHTTAPTTPPHPLSLLLSLPATYPIEAPPLLQLHSRYIGSDHVTDELFGEVVRVFMHDEETGEGVVWRAGEVCLYEGVEWVRERCVKWCGEREGERKRLEVVRRGVGVYAIGGAVQTGEGEGEWEVWGEDGRDAKSYVDEALARRRVREEAAQAAKRTSAVVCPRIVSAEPILDRKSVFIGHAAAVKSLDEVHLVIAELLSDKKIARATHNISAYRCTTADGVFHQDNDDDGESAAGSRMAHLLSLLDVHDVLVVVSRWYGGINLGADRFKHINTAARDALVAGGFLEEPPEKKKKGGKKK